MVILLIASPLVVSHMILAIGKVGFNLNIFRPDPVRHLLGRKWIKIEKLLIVVDSWKYSRRIM